MIIEYLQQPQTRVIPLTQGKFAIVDAEDYEWLNQYKWYAAKYGTTFYACRSKGRTTINMHRQIMCAPKGLICDHKNHNGLDNRKNNLRLCTNAQNQYNRRPRTGCSSRYKGVDWQRAFNKWRAAIRLNQTYLHLGLFHNEMEAALTYDRKAAELFGEFAWLNFPQLIEFRKWLKKLMWVA